VGVALPWIGAVCMVLFPAIGTTRIVNGRCLRMGVWPNEGMAFVSLCVSVLSSSLLHSSMQCMYTFTANAVLVIVILIVCHMTEYGHSIGLISAFSHENK